MHFTCLIAHDNKKKYKSCVSIRRGFVKLSLYIKNFLNAISLVKKTRRACLNNSRTVLQLKEICVCVYTTLKSS